MNVHLKHVYHHFHMSKFLITYAVNWRLNLPKLIAIEHLAFEYWCDKKINFAQTSLNNGTLTDVRHAVDELNNMKKHFKSKHIRPPVNFCRNTQCSCILSRIVYRCSFFTCEIKFCCLPITFCSLVQ